MTIGFDTPGFSDDVFKTVYAGWNDRGSAEGDWAAHANDKWKSYRQSQGIYTPGELMDKSKYDAEQLAIKQKADNDAHFAANRNDINSYITKYSGAVPGIVDAADTKFGVGAQLGYTNALNSRIQDLKGNLTGSGAGGYASGDQVDKAVNTKYLPLYETANTNLGKASTLAQNEVATNLLPIQSEGKMLSDQIARESTGYTNEQKNELDALLGRMQQGTQLTSAEIAQMTALSEQENQYNIAKLQADTANKPKPTNPSDRYISMGGKYLYDTQTGNFITAPGTSSGGSDVWY